MYGSLINPGADLAVCDDDYNQWITNSKSQISIDGQERIQRNIRKFYFKRWVFYSS